MAPCEDAPSESSGAINTLLFVDVDGVLNVGVSERNGDCLLLTEKTAKQAERLLEEMGPHFSNSAQRFMTVWNQPLPQEAGKTYASLACQPERHTSVELTKRLARLIELAGDRRKVVLSSSWRRPRYAAQVRELEEELSSYLGKDFAFDGATAMRSEPQAADRLRTLGDYVEDHCAQLLNSFAEVPEDSELDFSGEQRLRVLILEDFYAQALSGWTCDGWRIDSPAAVQRYIQRRAPACVQVSVKLIHTYDEYVLPAGRRFGVGCGLTLPNYQAAVRYLTLSGVDSASSVWPNMNLIAEVDDKPTCVEGACAFNLHTDLWELLGPVLQWPGVEPCGCKDGFEQYAQQEDCL